HYGADEPAGTERSHRSGAGGRSGARIRGGRGRSPETGGTRPQRPEGHRRTDQGDSGGNERGRRGDGRRHQGSGRRRAACRSGGTRAGRDFQRGAPVGGARSGNFARFEAAGAWNGRRGARDADHLWYYTPDVARSARNSGDGEPTGEALRPTERSAGAIPRRNERRSGKRARRNRAAPPGRRSAVRSEVIPFPGSNPGRKQANDERTAGTGGQSKRARAERDSHADRGTNGDSVRRIAGAFFFHPRARAHAREGI